MPKPRLRRSDTSKPGITRRKHGNGYAFRHPDGTKITDPDEIDRCRTLAIPPAWRDVWICPHPNGHIQATGLDDAGRKQYIYHARWSEKQSEKKFDHILDVGDALPAARPKVTRLLRSDEAGLEQACAAAFRLLDVAVIRVGNEEYAESNESYGLTTMRVQHLALDGDTLRLEFPAKSGQLLSTEVKDADLARVLAPALARGRDEHAMAYRDDAGWHPLTSTQVNSFLREITGVDMTAKDFRTWHATVTAALELAKRLEAGASKTRRARLVNEAMDAVAGRLHNTRSIARNSYVDPRVVDLFHDGAVIDATTYRQAERALRDFVN